MDRLLHTANALVSLAALVTAGGLIAAAGAAVTVALSWRAIRTMPPAAPDLARALMQDMETELDRRGIPADQHALIADMIEAALPEPSTLIDARLDPEAVLAQMEAGLQGTEQRHANSLHLFQIVLRPRLQRLLNDPAFTSTLEPRFMQAMLAGIDGIDQTTRATLLGVLRVEEKIDLLPGQFAELLQNLNRASRDQLEALAARFEIAGVYDLSDAALRHELDKRAEDWRALRREIAAIPDSLKQLSNLKGAAQAAFDAGRLDEVEALLARVHEVELEEAARSAELRAETALLRGRVDQAFTLLDSAADSFKPIDPLEPARRRINRYFGLLHDYGLRYGGRGLAVAEAIIKPALTEQVRDAAGTLWARGKMTLGIIFAEQSILRGDHEAIAMLEQAVKEYGAALAAYANREDAPDRALVLMNRGIALKALGQRYDRGQAERALFLAVNDFTQAERFFSNWPDSTELGNCLSNRGGALLVLSKVVPSMVSSAILRKAEDACRQAVPLLTVDGHLRERAVAQRNLGNCLLEQSPRNLNPDAALKQVEEAQAAFNMALEVSTRTSDPIDWALLQSSLARTECLYAAYGTKEDSAIHAHRALTHADAALEVFHPDHTPVYHAEASALRKHIREALRRL